MEPIRPTSSTQRWAMAEGPRLPISRTRAYDHLMLLQVRLCLLEKFTQNGHAKSSDAHNFTSRSNLSSHSLDYHPSMDSPVGWPLLSENLDLSLSFSFDNDRVDPKSADSSSSSYQNGVSDGHLQPDNRGRRVKRSIRNLFGRSVDS